MIAGHSQFYKNAVTVRDGESNFNEVKRGRNFSIIIKLRFIGKAAKAYEYT